MSGRHVVLAITGASGAVYGLRLGCELLAAGCRLTLLISRPGFTVIREECGLDWGDWPHETLGALEEYFRPAPGMLAYYTEDDLMAPVASGSRAPDAMVVCPCSMGSLARIAAGLSSTLTERCADVTLKEGRPLVLVPRETPLSAIHLENMLKLARLGVRIVPAMPGFYHEPRTVDDLVGFVVGKVLDALQIPHELFTRWGDVSRVEE
ncbi:UbiX family flavin prenyltransferase [Geobacter sulfurreducens]|jgi:4-hydroxy-3-polyprenylbenzoate decarboxylase|uniref:Flavin prenyltransferase UbiX n=1 Tax=Geobacter sulfurreducens (strain ATCC 51573 / DSM 12127 / PCA) TaxID=243231 RepID=Q74G12_GEOSL|nr:flavin prenyltransferase UbiX [Geobacter sulfurreducens]AAR33772.1 menaquinone biosynthesis decarboxylase, putative [Geobacter sulfurreducens PCA]UAC04520.1 UbiX family flavin prenyltransferase [Geobacter sulfurreducens]HBB69670.1 UbiX family flavin prenyltransferase [Geobacter sulfurreducens]HCD95989.1 UbiX family flavin prenyltransferase [Geobacter sulfurreducens]